MEGDILDFDEEINRPFPNIYEDTRIDRPRQVKPCAICGGVILRETTTSNVNVIPQSGSQPVPTVTQHVPFDPTYIGD